MLLNKAIHEFWQYSVSYRKKKTRLKEINVKKIITVIIITFS